MDLSREYELIRKVGQKMQGTEDLEEFLAHGRIVSRLGGMVAKELGNEDAFCREIRIAGILHDIGKLKLSDYIYGAREDIMDVEEVKYVRMHPTLGHDVLREEGGYSEEIISYIANHHENVDGSGYPNHIEGDAIPYGARILRVCDVFAALVSNRPYRAAFPVTTAVEMMIEDVKDFDMQVFLAFLSVVNSPDFEKIELLIEDARIASMHRRTRTMRKDDNNEK